MKRRVGLFLLVGVLLIGVMSVVGITQQDAEKIVDFGLATGDPGTLDPHMSTWPGGLSIFFHTYDLLVTHQYGNVDELKPGLAKSWEISEDKRTYTFNLRQGVQFHQGYGEMTAQDVVFSFDRASEGTLRTAFTENLAEIKALDKYTVQFKLKHPNPLSLWTTFGVEGRIYIMSEQATKELGEEIKIHPVGTGPFEFVNYVPNDRLVLRKFEKCKHREAIVDGVVFYYLPELASRELGLRKGELDVILGATDPDWIEEMKAEGYLIDVVNMKNQAALILNTSCEPFNELKVRKAIAHAINKQDIVDFFGSETTEATNTLAPSSWACGATAEEIGIPVYQYNPEKARDLLTQAGYPGGFTIETITSDASIWPNMTELIQAQLADVGIKMNFSVITHSRYYGTLMSVDAPPIGLTRSGRFDVLTYMIQHVHSRSQPGKPGGYLNAAFFSDPAVDALLEAAEATPSLEERTALVSAAQKLTMEQLPIVPLVCQRTVVVARRSELKYLYQGNDFFYPYGPFLERVDLVSKS